jgi:hypothetical protein
MEGLDNNLLPFVNALKHDSMMPFRDIVLPASSDEMVSDSKGVIGNQFAWRQGEHTNLLKSINAGSLSPLPPFPRVVSQISRNNSSSNLAGQMQRNGSSSNLAGKLSRKNSTSNLAAFQLDSSMARVDSLDSLSSYGSFGSAPPSPPLGPSGSSWPDQMKQIKSISDLASLNLDSPSGYKPQSVPGARHSRMYDLDAGNDPLSPYFDPRDSREAVNNVSQKTRQVRKAELARESRLRRKKYVFGLEAKIIELNAEIEKLERQAKGPLNLVMQGLSVRQDAKELASQGITRLTEACEPGQQVKFVLMGLGQEDSFYVPALGTDNSVRLWDQVKGSVCRFTETQANTLLSLRPQLRQDLQNQQQLRNMLVLYSQALGMYIENLLGLHDVLHRVLSPVQLQAVDTWVRRVQSAFEFLQGIVKPSDGIQSASSAAGAAFPPGFGPN